jgi:thiosulfate/3-mercaptopyruvate sulfurtransferase
MRITIVFLIAFSVWCAPAKGVELMLLQIDDAAVETDQLKFIDARPVKVWQQGHIPKARSFSWETYTHTDDDGIKYRTLPPEVLADALGKMGISHDDAVAVYGDADTSWGGEGWVAWVFAWLGHRGPVYVLDGGVSLWQSRGYPVEKNKKTDFPVATYRIDLQPDRNISAVDIAEAGNTITLVDTRNYFTEWLPGHLPDAVHIPWEKFYYGDHRRFLSTDALKRMLIAKGVDPAKPVVYYCTGGIRSGFTWMVHELAGLGSAKNFEGGTEEWVQIIKKEESRSGVAKGLQ